MKIKADRTQFILANFHSTFGNGRKISNERASAIYRSVVVLLFETKRGRFINENVKPINFYYFFNIDVNEGTGLKGQPRIVYFLLCAMPELGKMEIHKIGRYMKSEKKTADFMASWLLESGEKIEYRQRFGKAGGGTKKVI